MALTFGPAVSRTRQAHVIRAIHGLSMLVGAVMTYAILALAVKALSGIDRWVAVSMVVSLAVLALLRDLGIPSPVPYVNLQVAEWLRDVLPTWGVAAAFGWLLGLGFATKFTYGVHTILVAAVALLLAPGPAVGVLAVWVGARLLVTFIGSEAEGLAGMCARFAAMRTQLYLLRFTSALAVVLAIGLVIRVEM